MCVFIFNILYFFFFFYRATAIKEILKNLKFCFHMFSHSGMLNGCWMLDQGLFDVFSCQAAAYQSITKPPAHPNNKSMRRKSEFVFELPTLASPKAK